MLSIYMYYLARWEYKKTIFLCNEKAYIMRAFNKERRIAIKITEEEKIFIEKIFDLRLIEELDGALGKALF